MIEHNKEYLILKALGTYTLGCIARRATYHEAEKYAKDNFNEADVSWTIVETRSTITKQPTPVKVSQHY